jgi:hypothetical protein
MFKLEFSIIFRLGDAGDRLLIGSYIDGSSVRVDLAT